MRPVLETLEIRPPGGRNRRYHLQDLLEHMKRIPTLQQIRLHSSLLQFDDNAIEVADALLKSRARVKEQEDGTTTPRPEDAGIVVFDDRRRTGYCSFASLGGCSYKCICH